MTPRPVLALLGASAAVVAAGCAALAARVSEYLANPLTPSSTSGNRVFRLDDGSLGAYVPFDAGLEPLVIVAGLALLVASVGLAAALPLRRG